MDIFWFLIHRDASQTHQQYSLIFIVASTTCTSYMDYKVVQKCPIKAIKSAGTRMARLSRLDFSVVPIGDIIFGQPCCISENFPISSCKCFNSKQTHIISLQEAMLVLF
jgi:hypothetical protein